MRNPIRILLCLFLLGGAASCYPPQRLGNLSTDRGLRPPVLLPQGRIDERIASLEALLQQNGLSEEGRDSAFDLLNAYKKVKEASNRRPSDGTYDLAVQDLFYQLSAFEERYLSGRLAPSPRPVAGSERQVVLDAYKNGDYRAVIDRCLALKEASGQEALGPELSLAFALSLGKEGRLEEAVKAGEEAAARFAGDPNLMDLRIRLAEWYATLDRKEEAVHAYQMLENERNKEAEAMGRLSDRIAALPEPPTPLPSSSVSSSEPQATGPSVSVETPADAGELGGFFQQIDDLIGRKQFVEARQLLVAEKKEVSDPQEAEAIGKYLAALDLAEEKFLEEKIAAISHKEDDLEQAKKLIDEEKFAEAISSLESLEKNQLATDESRALKEKAIEKLIARERNRAAKLFLAARQSQDPAKKEAYLKESYEILKQLAENYPSSPLSEKVGGNMQRVKEELDKLNAVGRY